MGGINHQPCKAYLRNSTRLSRSLSLAHAELELGNVALEDVILAELEGRGHEPLDVFIARLHTSKTRLDEMHAVTEDLHRQMAENGYQDLPSLHTVDLDQTGRTFADEGKVSQKHWDEVAALMRHKGFWGVLREIQIKIEWLRHLTHELIRVSEILKSLNRSVSDILEENRASNIRPAFAILYTTWSEFHSFFLASSLLSTELWYRFNSFGSLSEQTAQVKAA
jgi:hypothetical protein